ncbi:MAG: M67 family metallopeptidase [Blastocatellia bacterium]|nr:M67 family metallopeptidase [Blastocatellia bacterium]
MALKIARTIIKEIIDQARVENPRECCGVLGGSDGEARTRYPLVNRSTEPERRYFAAPEDLFVVMRRMREAGEELVVIYHSHPRGPSHPSQTDIELAFYPEAAYLIVTLEPQTDARAFRISEGAVSEITMDIGDYD